MREEKDRRGRMSEVEDREAEREARRKRREGEKRKKSVKALVSFIPSA